MNRGSAPNRTNKEEIDRAPKCTPLFYSAVGPLLLVFFGERCTINVLSIGIFPYLILSERRRRAKQSRFGRKPSVALSLNFDTISESLSEKLIFIRESGRKRNKGLS